MADGHQAHGPERADGLVVVGEAVGGAVGDGGDPPLGQAKGLDVLGPVHHPVGADQLEAACHLPEAQADPGRGLPAAAGRAGAHEAVGGAVAVGELHHLAGDRPQGVDQVGHHQAGPGVEVGDHPGHALKSSGDVGDRQPPARPHAVGVGGVGGVVDPAHHHVEARVVPLPRFVADQLDRLLERRPTDPEALIFVTPQGRPIGLRNFRRRLDAAAKVAEWFTPYVLRHTCASLMAQKGIPVTTAAAIMGHDPAMFLRVYAHFYPGDLRGAAAVLDAARTTEMATARSAEVVQALRAESRTQPATP